jgi:poly-gamma-glutamate capsule biosynthesis protein CapA/YwtB (metallophosphatase superfamily)
MNIAFTGDLVLQEIVGKSDHIFKEVKNMIDNEDLKLCVNLETPFIEKGMKQIKNKISLYAYYESVEYLKYLNPHLINLSNNHINDYGNESAELTFKILKDQELDYYGVGLSGESNNIKLDKESKILQLSFCERSTDQTTSKLLSESDFIGPYQLDYKLISNLRRKFKDYLIIVNIHWGLEDIYFPEPSKRKLAYDIIDHGVDLIIGHHPHIIQPVEVYKGKKIFYSLGNFYFPDINYSFQGVANFKRARRHQKKGLIPSFEILDGKIISQKVKIVKLTDKGNLILRNYRLRELLLSNNAWYTFMHDKYLQFLRGKWILGNVVKNPIVLVNKIKNIIHGY